MNTQMEKPAPLVSCIVTCFQKVEYLFDAIDSVLEQDYPAIQLIVADDGTEGFPSSRVDSYIRERKNCNLQSFLVIHQESNVGTVRNINSAIKKSTGDYFINLDGDDVFYSKTVISEMLQYMLENDLDFLECSKVRCDEKLNELELLPTPEQKKKISKLNSAAKQFHSFAVFQFYNIGGGSGVAYTRKCVQRLGLFHEEFRNWQDGPTLISYVKQGRTIPTNFDIIAIRYRGGGVSNEPEKNPHAFSHIAKDRILFTEMYTAPDILNPHFFLRREKVFMCRWDTCTSFWKRVGLMLRFPERGFRILICKAFAFRKR